MLKQIPDFPDYSITKDGRVWSCRFKRWLKGNKNSNGYLHVCLRCNNKSYTRKIHRLVLETYIGPCPENMQCRHLNGNRLDNRLENLCWGTSSENHQDAIRHGTHAGLKLNASEREMVFYAYSHGTCTTQELADTYYVCTATILKIIREYIPRMLIT